MLLSIRRTGAVLLTVVFLAALFVVLAVLALNATFAREGFVSDKLAEADAYEFVLDDLVPALLEDAWQLDADEFALEFEENPLAASGLTPEQVAAAIRRAIPPEDLEALVTPALESVMDYLMGREDQVTIRVDAAQSLDALVRALTALFLESGAYERLLERELTPVFSRWVDEGLPPGGEKSAWVAILRGGGEEGGSLARVFTSVATPEWMAAQVEGAAAEGVDYAVARSDALAIRIGFGEAEVDQAAAEVAAVITEADPYHIVYLNVVEPVTRESTPNVSLLPYSVVLTQSDVVGAVWDAVSGEWLDEHASLLAADVAAYATGQTDTFVTTFDLAAAKPDAWHALTVTATASLRASLRDLPECATAAENATARTALEQYLPSCIPWDVPASDIVAIAVPAVATAIDEKVLGRIPDTATYSHQDLRDNLERDGGPDALLALDDIRELFSEGWTYTDADLRADLDDEDAFDPIQDARLALSTGYALDTSDEAPEGLDEVRDAIAVGTRDLWIPALVAAALLLVVAFLGGRGWRGRLAWAAGALLLSAAVLAVLFWTVAQSVSDGALDDVREEITLDAGSQFPNTSEALAGKLVEVAASAVDDGAGNIARNALILAVVGALGVLAAVFWRPIGAALGREQP